ncbi:MAG TPA: HAD family phosphatase [Spirochaetia bacterium]|nr:HAD family phosphatase [Spirochaetia bacterium]
MSIQAAIFDMDGLLIDSERLFMDLYAKAAMDFGYTIPQEAFIESIGTPSDDTRRILFRGFGDGVPVKEIDKKFLEILDGYLKVHGMPVKAGVIEFLDSLSEAGIRRAVATSNDMEGVRYLLSRDGLIDRFEVIVTRDDVKNPKPDPEIYLTTASRLGVEPSSCIVFEDSEIGINAALAAGMRACLVPDLIQPSAEMSLKAFRIYSSLREANNELSEILA